MYKLPRVSMSCFFIQNRRALVFEHVEVSFLDFVAPPALALANACTSSTKSMAAVNRPWSDLFSEFMWETMSLMHVSFKSHVCSRVSYEFSKLLLAEGVVSTSTTWKSSASWSSSNS